ncbi:uncharacterized protein N7459_006713 [Penicillium hispanicum]|uniref:uncharacterized protein n=1 Tax=Penicillium hispanicum TaxID=1080232 RepID=UPI00253FFB60|nr:uncharacterized protein N7459_006713 [Penicillium hispanicum]KAJ5577749.1 hypothetical protein N7459_006713 [Penicillium hispanicum]
MRPAPDLSSFGRKSSVDYPSPSLDPRTAAPATFFLSRNPHASELESSSQTDGLEDPKESMYGVQSLGDTLSRSEFAASPYREHAADDVPVSTPSQEDDRHDIEEEQGARRRSTLKPFQSGSPGSPTPLPVADASSRPLTPLNPDEPSSLPSSPKSFSNQSLRPLDEISITDEINSQAIISGDEEEKPAGSPRPGPGGASQLIMPSITMPSRRPFTERGKTMGRFKVLLAGAPGSGKSSLIKSIVQTCEDIVHADCLPPVASLENCRPSRPHSGSVPTRGTPAITEIYASTKPYPSWWSDLEDSRVLRRRKSMGEIVLERNICFVDTNAISLSHAGQTDSVLQYMRLQLHRAATAFTSSGIDFQNLIAGNGGSQVDAILYLISTGMPPATNPNVAMLIFADTLPTDVECIRKLCELSNVIPLVAKADTLSLEQVTTLKSQFHQQARTAGIKPFMFGDSSHEALNGLEPQPPYAVSSEIATDMEIMDASTLMSPDYVQPLVASELATLVQRLFDRDNLAWMRHSAAKKLIQRRGDFVAHPATAVPIDNARFDLSAGRSPWGAASGMSANSSVSSLGETQPSYTMARISDYTHHEERMAQVRLAQWATDLQRSLQNERDRYAALARSDRAVWLTERLSECVVDGSLVPISQTPGLRGLHIATGDVTSSNLHATRTRGSLLSTKYHIARLSPHDPLGVVGWLDDLGRRGWVLVQIVGSVGVVGGLALWLARTWGLPTRSLSELHLEYLYGSMEH